MSDDGEIGARRHNRVQQILHHDLCPRAVQRADQGQRQHVFPECRISRESRVGRAGLLTAWAGLVAGTVTGMPGSSARAEGDVAHAYECALLVRERPAGLRANAGSSGTKPAKKAARTI